MTAWNRELRPVSFSKVGFGGNVPACRMENV